MRDGAIVVVDVAKEHVGADIAAMIGGTLINLLALAVGHQAGLRPDQRRHVALLVDEFHALPAANYEAFLAELAKYGASLMLATQSLGALDEVDPGRGLRARGVCECGPRLCFQLLGGGRRSPGARARGADSAGRPGGARRPPVLCPTEPSSASGCQRSTSGLIAPPDGEAAIRRDAGRLLGGDIRARFRSRGRRSRSAAAAN